MILKKTPLFLAMVCLSHFQLTAQKWTADSFESFSRGIPGASGQNTYISKKGEIRTIRRFDLNNDGYIDLLFNNTHNDDAFIPASVAAFSGDGKVAMSSIHVQGSLASSASDLNKDGYPDIVFCPNPSGIQNPRRFVTIAYGTKNGWPNHLTNGLLPVNDVKSVVVADLNKDGWPDIATLNSTAWRPGQPEGNIIRIYWGRKQGFALDHYQDVGVADAQMMISADLDGDGYNDLAIGTQKAQVKILWASPTQKGQTKFSPAISDIKLPESGITCLTSADLNGDKKADLVIGNKGRKIYLLNNRGQRLWTAPKTLSDIDVSSITAGDLDRDGNTDLVVSKFSLQKAAGGEMLGGKSTDDHKIRVFWGNKGTFSNQSISEFEAPYTVNTAIGDLNGDGIPDIVCAVHQGKTSYATESLVFQGKAGRQFERSETGIPGSGAYHALIVPAGAINNTQVIISNSRAGNLNEEVPLHLYWGSAKGFSPENRLDIPFKSGYEATAADFNEDGHVDLLAINSMHSGIEGEASRGVNIFWGSDKGFDLINSRTVLNEEYASTSNVADFNKDGYLDLVIGFFDRPDQTPTELVFYYGSSSGFELKNRKTVACKGRSSSPTIADYNKDGWLDIAVTSYEDGLIRIFWGGIQGFSENNAQKLEMHSIIDLETADLNRDGYLDLIAASYKDKVNDHHDTGVFIYWGSENGFAEWNAQWLPGNTVLGPTVADFDADGFLDLFFPSYHSDITRENLPMMLYWGSKEGYKPNHRTVLIGESGGTDALAADFDKDGKIDLAVAAHTLDGFHSKGVAKVYYNDGKRFQSPDVKITHLPSPGSHWIWNYDMGNIYNRKWEEHYESEIFNLSAGKTRGTLRYEADIPKGTKISVWGRSAETKEKLTQAEWIEIQNNTFALEAQNRNFQYNIKLISDNGDRYPIVKKITLDIK